MATTAVLDGLNINTAPYTLSEPLDFGDADVRATFQTGDLHLEEYDQYAAELRYVRQVTLPFNIRSGSFAQSIADTAAVTAKLAKASRYSTIDFVFTPNGGNASTFKVIGGSLQVVASNQQVNLGTIRQAVLVLDCYPFIEGASQSLGSSGAPLVTNTASPASVTLSPSPTGDVPGRVTLFVKNRSASAIRSLIVAGVSGNTTWGVSVPYTSWTADAAGHVVSGRMFNFSQAQDVVGAVAHFTAPTLPSDRRFRVVLRAAQNIVDSDSIYFRVRLVSGQVEVVGQWRSIPQEADGTGTPLAPEQAVDMGAWTFPVGEVGTLGAQSTTVYVEAMQTGQLVTGDVVQFAEAVFLPDDSYLKVETTDTGKTLAAASGIIRVESNQAYDNTGNPIGVATQGSHIRTTGGKYLVYTSQGFTDSLDSTLGWLPESVDVWATFIPRSIGLL